MLIQDKIFSFYKSRLDRYGKYLIIYLVAGTSCKKLVNVDPPLTQLTGTNIYTSNTTAAAAVTGMYTLMSNGSFATGSPSISLGAGLSADELQGTNLSLGSSLILMYKNALSSTTSAPYWGTLYSYIHTTNATLEGISASSELTPSVKQQLMGEAKFMRAFLHFYLVNFYGDVPLVTTSNYEVNAIAKRTPQKQVYDQIIADLKDAKNLLGSDYLAADAMTASSERVRPTKWAAIALLARAYLYKGDWVDAEAQADTIINNAGMFSLVNDLDGVFLKNSKEAIWQLQPVSMTLNTLDGNVFILAKAPNPSSPVFLNTNLLNSFEIGDNRRMHWVHDTTIAAQAYSYPFKYKVKASAALSEYLMVLRLGEQYLIRAEARAQQGNTTEAASDLNAIRNRAGLLNTTGTMQSDLLTAIYHERQVELFTEWGHRWLDLKRTSMADAVMSIVTPQKGGVWSTNWQWYPLPLTDIQKDPNLTQNIGYY